MKNNTKHSLALRLLIGFGAPVGALCVALIFFLSKKTPPCVFFEITGLYCVGCGAGRAFLSLLGGDLYAAFRYNPLLIILLPFMAYYLLNLYIAFVFGKNILPFPKISARWIGISLLIIIVAFWIFRNIPVLPFSYLAPTAI